MNKRRDLLEKFINHNFDLTCFIIKFTDDFMVSLIDYHGNQLDLVCYDNETIFSFIEGTKFLTYKLDKDLENNEYFRVI